MSQEKQISQLINALLSDDLATADKYLKGVMETKLVARIQEADAQLEEGFFDRLGAKTAGLKAGIGTKAQNFGTGVKGGLKAAGQAVTGNLGKAALTLGKTAGAINKNDASAAAKNATIQSITQTVETDLTKLFPGDPAIQKVLTALAELGKAKAVATPKTSGAAKVKSTPGIAAPANPVLPSAAPVTP